FTYLQDDKLRSRFIASLFAALNEPHSRLRIIITIRDEFYDRLLAYNDFGHLVKTRSEKILPLNRDEMLRAITGPTERRGIVVDKELTDAILQDIGTEANVLPLLQYVLTELFERHPQKTLRLEDYRNDTGVRGTIARRADELHIELDPAWKETPSQVFMRL